MNAGELTALKAYLHVDHDGDDVQLQALYQAAVEYLAGAGIPQPQPVTDLYLLAAWGLTLEAYDGTAVGQNLTAGLRRVINQLKSANPSF